MSLTKVIKVEACPGDCIRNTIKEMLVMAKQENCRVEITFNDFYFWVSQYSTYEDTIKYWEESMKE